MYNTKEMLHMDVRDYNNGELVDWYNIDMGKIDSLSELENAIIEKIHSVDQLIGREYRTLYAKYEIIIVRA